MYFGQCRGIHRNDCFLGLSPGGDALVKQLMSFIHIVEASLTKINIIFSISVNIFMPIIKATLNLYVGKLNGY